MIPFLRLKPGSDRPAIEAAVARVIDRGWFILGPELEAFESEFAAWHGRKYGLMTPNCTTSIHLLLAGLGIDEGDEVIVPACTWIGSVAPVVAAAAAVPVVSSAQRLKAPPRNSLIGLAIPHAALQ